MTLVVIMQIDCLSLTFTLYFLLCSLTANQLLIHQLWVSPTLFHGTIGVCVVFMILLHLNAEYQKV